MRGFMNNRYIKYRQIFVIGIALILLSLNLLDNVNAEDFKFHKDVLAFAFILLIACVCFLLVYIVKSERTKRYLLRSYDELIAAKNKLNYQYDEIIASHEKIKQSEERLLYQAFYDVLTGLPNKTLLYEDSKESFIEANTAVLFFIDMDHFKYINNTLGHAFGDMLIKKVGERLAFLLKDNCNLYRFGGDEFVIIIKNIRDKKDVEIFASHILAGFKEEFLVLNSVIHISLSIGAALYPEHGKNIDELLKFADIAMYKAKEKGRKGYVIYDNFMNEAFTERMNIEKQLHNALGNNEFKIYYQPQLDIRTNKIAGFEALLRWENPELGYISPLKFIKVAEDTHLIIPLGTWVIRNACSFLQKLHNKGHKNLKISVNISILQLLQTDFIDLVLDTLSFFDLEPEYLELEITESILIESFEIIGQKLIKLSETGIRIALDDFGTGYSSLNYLKQLPISTLKIDKSFVDNINADNLTEHIITIGKSLGMSIVAEGVERQEQLDYLIRHECDKIQGYLFSKPVIDIEIINLLEDRATELIV